MAKVNFKRIENSENINTIDINDGNFIVTGDGKSYIDYGTDRNPTSGTPDMEMSDSSRNTVENKVIKEYVDDKVLDVYSTTESIVGKWIDGKPIYRKVLEFTNVPTGVVQRNHGISNFDKLINYSGYYYNSIWGYNPIPAVTSDNISGYGIGIGDFKSTTFYFNIGNLRSSTNEIKLIVEYTKTTD